MNEGFGVVLVVIVSAFLGLVMGMAIFSPSVAGTTGIKTLCEKSGGVMYKNDACILKDGTIIKVS